MQTQTRKLTFLVISAVLTAVMLTIAGCSGVRTINPDRLKLDKAYKFTAGIRYGEFTATADFERTAAEQWTVMFTEPYALSGIVMTYNNGELTAVLENLQSHDHNPMSVIKCIISSFENAVIGEGREIIERGEELNITSRAGNRAESYEMVFDKNRLEPMLLKVSDRGLTVTVK